ncbi:MAG: ATP-binding protein [Eubacteriales bacterium]
MFYGREKELSTMQKKYDNNSFECIIIYGRRRVGKTALINTFCKDKKTIYFSALETTAKENLKTLSKAIHFATTDAPVYESYDHAFQAITDLTKEERLIFVIDEYPYLAKCDTSISSRIQHFIDHQWEHSKLYLILCGSSMSFMENQVLGYQSPLFGRRTAQFKITAMTYKEMTAFHPSLSNDEQALLYGITGGVPHYINKLQVKNNITTALIENLFDTSSYLFEEPDNLLKQELREPAIYNSIIKAIADGSSKLNQISTKSGLETSKCTKYLSTLIGLGIIKKETPITEKIGKKTIYRIEDNFFRFWYRFVPSNISAIHSDTIAKVYPQTIEPFFSNYMGLIFEKMCKDYLLRYTNHLPIILSDLGSWWGTDKVEKKEVEIDIIGTPASGNEYIIASCKFRNEKIGVDELMLLQKYAHVFGKGSKYHYYIFSKSGFTKELLELSHNQEVYLLTLDDLYVTIQPQAELLD